MLAFASKREQVASQSVSRSVDQSVPEGAGASELVSE
jgi:hypothetical protein